MDTELSKPKEVNGRRKDDIEDATMLEDDGAEVTSKTTTRKATKWWILITVLVSLAIAVVLAITLTGSAQEESASPIKSGNQVTEESPYSVDYSCQTDSDCSVKDVGNCCGSYFECVNDDFIPDRSKSCPEEGMASICGWAEIDRCICQEGRCEGYQSPP